MVAALVLDSDDTIFFISLVIHRDKWPPIALYLPVVTRGVNPGVGVLTPGKYVRWVRVCFDPLRCHILSLKTAVGQLCKFHIIKDERLVSKMEDKTNRSRRLQVVRNRHC